MRKNQKMKKQHLAHLVPFKGVAVDWLMGQLLRDVRKNGCPWLTLFHKSKKDLLKGYH